ncbi:M20/M25/M40 family metallo-hydrolase [Candidatus Woesearchaeota archaeon]|nr:M20/M25/M40 family metallo-hydrolase [Candidatus Woesearchaeota archaeon]
MKNVSRRSFLASTLYAGGCLAFPRRGLQMRKEAEEGYTFTNAQINTFLDARIGQFAQDLSELVQIDSESEDPVKAGKLVEIIDALEKKFTTRGFKTHRLEALEKGRVYPALVAAYEVDPAAPWVLIYNHADVQPGGEREKWQGEKPFSGRIDHEQGIVYGRGATDDKGPLLGTVYALEFLIQNNLLKVNVACISETGEESGSPGFKEMAQKALNQGIIKRPSHVFVSDTEFKEGHPNLLAGLRGFLNARVSLAYAKGTMHSGIFGDNVPSAVEILSNVLGSCKNPYTGRVQIEGFYDSVADPTAADLALLEDAGQSLTVEGLKKAATAYVLRDESAMGMLRKTGLEPSLAVHIYKGGGFGTGIAPAAEAYVTMRLVHSQDPERIKKLSMKHLDNYFRKQTQIHSVPHLYGGVAEVQRSIDPQDSEGKRYIFPGQPCRLEVEFGHAVRPSRIVYDTVYHAKALEAYARFFEKRPIVFFEGGTIGTIPILQDTFGHDMPFVLFAQSQDTDGYHQEREHYHLDHARRAISAAAQYFSSLREPER